jgi:hypothetical protein
MSTFLEAAQQSRTLRLAVLAAILASHLVPTLIIAFGFVIPGTCVAGWNPLMAGFLACLAGFVPTFVAGTYAAWRFARLEAAGGSR